MWTVWAITHAPVVRGSWENIVRGISTNAGLGPAMLLAALTAYSWSMITSAVVALDTQVVIVNPWWTCVCPSRAIMVVSAQ